VSFILDALRKSEIERQRQSGPSIAEIPIAREDRRLPVALIAIGVLLAVNVGVLLFFLLRDGGAPEPAIPQTAAATNPAPPAAAPAAVIPVPSPIGDPVPSGPPSAVIGEPSAFYPSQTFPEPTMAPEAPDPTLLPPAPAMVPGGRVTYGDGPPVPTQSLPTQPAAELPPLTVDLHIYTDNVAKRAVFINGRRYTQGATITEGPRIEEITSDGAILSYRGHRFLLPRQ
jgi:general secretion pathway protein B